MERPSFSMEDELLEKINKRLTYGDNRSEWMRDAIRLKLAIVEITEELDENMTNEERRELVVKALQEFVDE